MSISRGILQSSLYMTALLLLFFTITACDSSSSSSAPGEPTISSTYPVNDAVNVPLNHKITATFSEPMDSATINDVSFTALGSGEPALTGTVTMDTDKRIATFSPSSDFTASKAYTATVTIAAKSAKGVSMASAHSWAFTTGTQQDTTSPEVILTHPVDLAADVAINSKLSVTFSKSMDPASLNNETFTLALSSDLSASVAGIVSLNTTGTTAKFTPTNNLASDTTYMAIVTTESTDNADPSNSLEENFIWSFTTGAIEAHGPNPVLLGTAGDFVILTKTGITNVPVSPITGNIGSSPITASAIDVTCTEITGTIYGSNNTYTGSGDTSCFLGDSTANTLVANAVLDMGIAYTDAAGRTTPDYTELHAGDLSGQTLESGLYKWGTGVLISTDMTFDGGANDFWILQVAGDLTVANNVSINLSGGADAKNIFWQIGGSSGAIIGTNAHIAGILLVEKAITLETGASVNGRLLSQTEVTLQQNALTEPAH